MRLSPTTLPILAGLGCLAVIAVGALAFREEIAARYHLHRLRGEPGYLLEVLDRPEGTAARAGVREYLESPEGKDALLRVCLGWHDLWPEIMTKTARAELAWCISDPSLRIVMMIYGKNINIVQDLHDSPRGGVRLSLFRAMAELLPGIGNEPRTLAEYPGLVFRVRASRDGDFACAIERSPAVDPPPATP